MNQEKLTKKPGGITPDLKAENNALKRQLAIEAALERVRARTMAMKSSEELSEVALVLWEQLNRLKLKELPGCAIHVNDDENGTFDVWGAFPEVVNGKKEMKLRRGTDQQDCIWMFKVWYQHYHAGDSSFTAVCNKRQLNEFIDWVEQYLPSMAKELRNQQLSQLYASGVAFSNGIIGAHSLEPLSEETWSVFKKLAAVFDQAYRRFEDLKKAEAQAREAQIEAALERVRARALAMHSSYELYEVALVLREQMGLLGQPDLEASVIHIYPEDSEAFQSWYAMRPPGKNQGKIVQGVAKFSYKESEVARECVKAFRSTAKEYTIVAKGKKLKEWLAQLAKQAPEIIKYFKGVLPEKHIYHFSDFSGGSLLMVTYTEPAEESKILQKRAAAVFDLAYKRFLDLKKAEEQTREAEIELALERVRARTMAMQHSDELADASLLLAQQVKSLGIETWGCAYHIYDEDSDTATEWFSNHEAAFPTYKLKRENIFLEYYQEGKKGESLYVKQFEGRACQKHYQYLCTLPVVGESLKEMKAKGIPFPSFQIDHVAYLKYGHLLFITFEPVPESYSIFTRIASVFEQTYTRFLDLKKAEEQAREAQIEAALERVRSRTMAMQHSKELPEIALVIWEQLDELKLEGLPGCAIHVNDDDQSTFDAWAAFSDLVTGERKVTLTHTTHDQHCIWVYREWDKYYRAGEKNFSAICNEKRLNEFIDWFAPMLPHLAEEFRSLDLHRLYVNGVAFSNGILGAPSVEPLSEETWSVFKRLAGVFDMAYRRFEDLKKAEEQAREAQIEAALERVRARALAMHSSDEILEVAEVMREEMGLLGQPELAVSAVHIYTKEAPTFDTWWAFVPTGKGKRKILTGISKIRINTSALAQEFIQKHDSNQNEYTIFASGKRLREWQKEVAFVAPKQIKSYRQQLPKEQYFHFSDFTGGALVMVSYQEPSQESKDLQKRAAAVFNLAYQRFLDLKIAEAQAREAQVEAALERVRSRSMAMQESAEIANVLGKIFTELTSLDVELERCIIWIIDQESESAQAWIASSDVPEGSEYYFFPNSPHPYYKKFIKAWRSKESLFELEIKGKLKQSWDRYLFEESEFKNLPPKAKSSMQSPGKMFTTTTCNQYGLICAAGTRPMSDQGKSIFQRFGRVFKQSYTRFEDIKKAEAQAREAKIEAALERVRSRTMGMQKSEEMLEVGALLYQELSKLDVTSVTSGITLVNKDEKIDWYYMVAVETDSKSMMKKPMGIPRDETKVMRSLTSSWEKQESYHVVELNEKETIAHQTYIAENSINFHLSAQELISLSPLRLTLQTYNFKHGYLLLVGGDKLSRDKIDIGIRFAKVFEQTYTRFLDLKQAEEQAREAQIEAALERVRAAAMAMHSSNDLFSVAEVLHDQLAQLGQKELEASIIHIYPDDLPTFDAWYSYRSTGDETSWVMDRALVPKDACSWTREVMDCYHSNQSSYLIESRGKMLKDWYRVLENGVAPAVIDYDKNGKIVVPKVLYYHFSKFTGGALLMIADEPPSDEACDMQLRAAQVFDLAYRRFLDLEKAELQAREARVEAALERVRSSTMAMHSSDDVGKATMVLFQELENLGIETFRCGVSIIKENKTMEVWTASTSSGGEVFNVSGIVDMTFHPMVNQLFEHWKAGKDIFTYELKGKDAQRYYQDLNNMPNYSVPIGKGLPDRHISNGFLFKEGALFAFTEDYFTEEASDIFQKFTNVFTLTYGRYLDLKKAEAREKEAIKQSSLDRVRAEIASMRYTDDLQRITPLVWRELTSLGVPFFRCGVFIIDEPSETVHMYLSTPEGEPLAALHLGFDEKEIPLVHEAISHWQTQAVHRMHWDQQQFRNFTKSLKNRGLIKNLKTYQMGEKPPKNLNLHQVPFKQGMLYVGSSEPLSGDQIELVKSLADAFSVAYSRYEDFVQLEEAKQSVENTLSELKSAQNQLIHSEKMASLGELTAGIAHEIQNPLNFVNNFSEVSTELLIEMKDEIESGNPAEVVELINDLIQNLDKIAHHGKRASGIVKGMLDHSRASSEEKVLTDINVLADEYLRLAYHGFRAKDKSFNANFKTELVHDLPKIDIVSQDIGRVILNLVNNAFQAVKHVTNPEVVVTTRHGEKGIEVSIIDNGPGIPEEIKDKIFQPFFTTKAAGEGTGLGLSLSYDIVTKGHGGTIEVKSSEKGTEFVICLPT
ncbi:MAG: hypothetical protein DHS20C17_02240 [Cyclobacteriaceae bacterium]|nr:MAG: hypothetical protein DHS20C17_02240 [Cyclobacteriaceae bacterium]